MSIDDPAAYFIWPDLQSINVVESPEFRKMMLCLGDGKLNDDDLPKRAAITAMILDTHKEEIKKTGDDMKASEGRISYTMDIWTDPNLWPFMAVTAHYYKRNYQSMIEYRSGLIAFRHTPGNHTGQELCRHLFKIIRDYGVEHKVCPNVLLFAL